VLSEQLHTRLFREAGSFYLYMKPHRDDRWGFRVFVERTDRVERFPGKAHLNKGVRGLCRVRYEFLLNNRGRDLSIKRDMARLLDTRLAPGQDGYTECLTE